MSVNDKTDRLSLVEQFIIGILLAPWCGLLFTLGYQVLFWLRYDTWPHISLVAFLLKFYPTLLKDSWLVEPHGWYGLHKLVIGIIDLPLALFLFFLGVLFLWLAVQVHGTWDEYMRKRIIQRDTNGDA